VTKRFGAALAVGVLGSVLSSEVASADFTGVRPPYGPPEGAAGPPNAGCPTSGGWFLVTPSGPEHLSAAYDFNYDNRVCARFLNDGSGAVTFMDNVVR
jgi:hypothetical protein